MSTLNSRMRRLIQREEGQDLIEYALVVALIAFAAVTATTISAIAMTDIATATSPFGGETTVIALDGGLTESGLPILDLAASGTLKPELLVGEDGAKAIAKARAESRA